MEQTYNSLNTCIFLDIDGVITSPRVLSWYNWDIYTVNFLRWICEELGVKIVISSTWRKNHDKEFFETILGNNIHEDWRTPILGRKMSGYRGSRGREIDNWLSKHPEVKNYIILDDDSDILDEQMDNFIQTDSENGMLVEHMYKICKKLGITNKWRKEDESLFQHEYMFATYNLK